MSKLITTLGPLTLEALGPSGCGAIILPHEHIFVDLRTPDHPEQGQAEVDAVVALMEPELVRARDAGVVALVSCTPVGVGRRPDAVCAVSEAAQLPIVLPTGVYREPWIPAWVHVASESALRDWMLHELLDGVLLDGGLRGGIPPDESAAATRVPAGWIKLSAGDDGITPVERKVLRAAAVAAAESGAVMGSHTIQGRVVLDQLDTLEEAGATAERFIWIHAQAEPDVALHEEVASTGAWIEYDGIGGSPDDATYVSRILHMLEEGYEDQLLLSHDRGWYDPAQPGGGRPRPFTYIGDTFLPQLIDAGLTEEVCDKLLRLNPFRAFAR